MSETKTLGIVGQMYEDRRTGRLGTLESSDEKYRTILMVAPDGSTFNITFSSFKSNWRKYVNELPTMNEVEEVAEQVIEDTVEESEPVAEEVEAEDEIVEEKPAVKRTRKSNTAIKEIMVSKLEEFLAGMNDAVSLKAIPHHNGYAIKVNNTRVFEVYAMPKFNKFKCCMFEDFYSSINWDNSLGLTPSSIDIFPDFHFTLQFRADADKLVTVLNDIKEPINNMCKKTDEEEE